MFWPGSADFAFALAKISDYLLPVKCCVCKSAVYSLCEPCREFLQPAPVHEDLGGLSVFSGKYLSEELVLVLRAFKDQHQSRLAKPLAALLRAAYDFALADYDASQTLLVPIPQTLRARRSRGFYPLRMLADASDLPLTNALTWQRKVQDQRGLSVQQRAANLSGALKIRGSIKGASVLDNRHIVLVDDVVTTGATLHDGARALRRAGASSISAITLANTAKRIDFL